MKIISIFISLFFIFGCHSNTLDDYEAHYKNVPLKMYHMVVNEFLTTSSLSTMLKYDNIQLEDSYYLKREDLKNGLTVTSWYVDGKTYIDDELYKHVYEGAYSNIDAFQLVSFDKHDYVQIKKEAYQNKIVYVLDLSNEGYQKLKNVNAMYHFINQIETGVLTVTFEAGYVSEVNLLATNDDATFELAVTYESVDKLPTFEAQLFKPFYKQSDTSLVIDELANYQTYLHRIGYNSKDVLKISDQQYYRYDFDKGIYMMVLNGIAYQYDYINQIGSVQMCVVNYQEDTQEECSDYEKLALDTLKHSFEADVSGTSISDYHLLKRNSEAQ